MMLVRIDDSELPTNKVLQFEKNMPLSSKIKRLQSWRKARAVFSSYVEAPFMYFTFTDDTIQLIFTLIGNV